MPGPTRWLSLGLLCLAGCGGPPPFTEPQIQGLAQAWKLAEIDGPAGALGFLAKQNGNLRQREIVTGWGAVPHALHRDVRRFDVSPLADVLLARDDAERIHAAASMGRTRSEAFLDGHVHLNDPTVWRGLMEDAGLRGAVVLRGRSAGHEDLIRAAEQWPGQLFPFVSISPEHREYRGSWDQHDSTVVEIVDSLLESGAFYGIGEISVSHFPGAGFPEADYDPNGPVMNAVLQAARRHDVPVLVHAEITRLREFEALLSAHPEVEVIWAHGGYTPLFIAERMLMQHPNLTYELSARTWIEHPRSPDYTILKNAQDVWPAWLNLVESMPNRFVVGSDASLRSIESDWSKILSVQNFLAQLSPGARARVAHETLAGLLRH